MAATAEEESIKEFDVWMHYQQPNIPTLQEAFAAGWAAGIASTTHD